MPAHRAPGHGAECVCTVCTCGHHHCTPPTIPFRGTTTHQADYTPKRAPQSAPRPHSAPPRPRAAPQSVPFRGSTTHQTDFVAFPLPPHAPQTQTAAAAALHSPPPLPFRGTTTQRADFTPKRTAPPHHAPPPHHAGHTVATALPGQYHTTQRESYVTPPATALRSRPSSAPRAYGAAAPTPALRCFETTQRADYTPKHVPRIAPRPHLAPQPRELAPDDPRRFRTTHRTDYLPFDPAARSGLSARPCPVLALDYPTRSSLSHYQ